MKKVQVTLLRKTSDNNNNNTHISIPPYGQSCTGLIY